MDGSSDEDLRAFLPASFGKQTKVTDVASQIGRSKRKAKEAEVPTIKEQDDTDSVDRLSARKSSISSEESSNSDGSDSEDDEFPVSHELVLKTHEKAVTSMTLDPNGSRLITSSSDCTIKFHDFASMTPTTLHAFKSVDPTASKHTETHAINYVAINPLAASQLLVIAATSQAKILSRDGETLTEFNKGDMYLRDMHNTKGHVSEITTAAWHPTDRNLFVTAGTDSTLRIWDVNKKQRQKEVIVHKSRIAGSGGRTRMTAVVWGSPPGGVNATLIGAALDGSLAMWSGNGPHTRPAAEIRGAHLKDTWTGGLDISSDGRMVVTRGGDDTIKIWDLRKFKSPLISASHPSTSGQFPTTNIQFSPSGANVLTGSQTGHLHILNLALRSELVTPVTPGSPLITVLWHDKINQIVTGSANAEVHVLYDPARSNRGAAMVMSKAPKRRHIDDDPNFTTDLSQGISDAAIINPNGLLPGGGPASTSFAARHPTVGLTASGRSRDPRRPQVPAITPFGKTQPDEEKIKQHIPLSSMRDEDPREALLKYAEKAKNDPMFTNAWKNTQPKTLYAELSDDDETGPEAKKIKR